MHKNSRQLVALIDFSLEHLGRPHVKVMTTKLLDVPPDSQDLTTAGITKRCEKVTIQLYWYQLATDKQG
jgi:hypothetical protein